MTLPVYCFRSQLFLFVLTLLFACNSVPGKKEADESFVKGTKEGYELAKYHCGNCHSFVAANTLDRKSWENTVLPEMAGQLGIEVIFGKEYVNSGGTGALITFRDWKKIVDYYLKNSPDTIAIPPPPFPILKDTSLFIVKTPEHNNAQAARTTLVSIDTATDNIFTSDAQTNRLYKWNNKLELIDSTQIFSPAVSAVFFSQNKERQGVFAAIGSLHANNTTNGKVLQFDLSRKLNIPQDTIAVNLPRPVNIATADFNNDGEPDWIVCGFGHTTGGLYLVEKSGNGTANKRPIFERPGATQAIADDFNNDGWMDLAVLFAHEDECIRLFANDKKGGFTETKLLSFPPVNGSTSFQFADFNNDGLQDILYTCGDNADLSRIFKPFHGVYVYLNKGNSTYEQAYFYPINGCTKAVAADLDMDGKTDIATIAFYADFRKRPMEKFIFLKQDGPLHFQPYSPPIENNGRWLCMDLNDYDSDGDIDIILGNYARDFFVEESYQPHWNMNTPFTILENNRNQTSK